MVKDVSCERRDRHQQLRRSSTAGGPTDRMRPVAVEEGTHEGDGPGEEEDDEEDRSRRFREGVTGSGRPTN